MTLPLSLPQSVSMTERGSKPYAPESLSVTLSTTPHWGYSIYYWLVFTKSVLWVRYWQHNNIMVPLLPLWWDLGSGIGEYLLSSVLLLLLFLCCFLNIALIIFVHSARWQITLKSPWKKGTNEWCMNHLSCFFTDSKWPRPNRGVLAKSHGYSILFHTSCPLLCVLNDSS